MGTPLKIVGFTIARNAVRFGYPLEESLRSMLPLVDELVVAVGDGEDATWELVQGIGDPKIRAFRTVWDMNHREGGEVLSEQTNLALKACTGDWGLYLQADEVLHEHSLEPLRAAMARHLDDGTEGLNFRYLHFYGSYQTVQDHPRKWYAKAVRAVRLGLGVESWGDAMGFRLRRADGTVRDLKTRDSGVTVHHYGWARPPRVMVDKQKNLDRFYHDDAWLSREYLEQERRVKDFYADRGDLVFFKGSHPAVMRARVEAQDWDFDHGIANQWPDWVRHIYNPLFYRIEIRVKRVGGFLRHPFRRRR